MKFRNCGIAAFLICSVSFAGDWGMFRGPNATGVSDESGLPVKMGPKENVKWSADLPARGVSSPVVAGGVAYLTSSGGVNDDRLFVTAFDADSGKQLWNRQIRATGNTGKHPKSAMAAPTPAADAEGVYALFATGDLVAFTKSGDLKWYRSLVGDYPNIANQVGMASSPVLAGDVLAVPMDSGDESFIAGLKTSDGTNLWKTPRPKEINWTTPVVREAKAGLEVLFQTRSGLFAYDAKTGKEAWSYKLQGGGIPTPIVLPGDKVLVPASALICLDVSKPAAPKELWKTPKVNSGSSSAVAYKGRVYNVNGSGVLVAADAENGDEVWQERLKGKFWASPIVADGRIYVPNDTGTLFVVGLGEQPELLASNQIGDELMGTPAVSGGKIFVRTDKKLYCFALPGGK